MIGRKNYGIRMKNLREYIAPELEMVNELILISAQSYAELIPTITNYLTQSGGKRLRPILTLGAAKLLGINSDAHIKLATAVEYIHTATLLHDDVIDESELRRGNKTANNVWGNKASILVGDFLLSQSFKLMVDAGSLEALNLLATTAKEITESEVWQLELTRKIDTSLEDYIKLVRGKTAVLFAAAASVGAVAMQQSKHIVDSLYQYGLNLGICFQIVDDLLDYSSSSDEFGKVLGNDLKEGKVTMPLILAYQDANIEDKKFLKNLIAFGDCSADSLLRVRDIFQTYQSIEKSKSFAKQYAALGIEAIKSANLSLQCEVLIKLLEEQIARAF